MSNRRSAGFIAVIYFLMTFIFGLSFIYYLGPAFYSAGAILLSAILALSGALMNVFFQRRTARESNSLSFQQSLSDNEDYISSVPKIINAINNRDVMPLQEYTKPEYANCDEAKAIRNVLNTWERAANAMRHGIYDERYLYEAHKTMVIHLGIYLRGYIVMKQKEQISFYENFIWLVVNWTIRKDSFEEAASREELKRIFKALNRVKLKRK